MAEISFRSDMVITLSNGEEIEAFELILKRAKDNITTVGFNKDVLGETESKLWSMFESMFKIEEEPETGASVKVID